MLGLGCNGRGQSRDPVWGSLSHISVMGEPRHFKYDVLIDTKECHCLHNRIPLSASCGLCKFCEIADILKTVHGRDIAAVED